ncbi:MAG: ComEA family DNA-binding protein [Inconstantimicrobium porci]|uniref:ComEA family DNA-binding protein n=1 Tax=Inconstantimicrobium porci TaxID=2652291 RepID=UPI002A91E7F6|nr:ComEA family DNA-binding protein [Inconstantimicrobium porci]MDY5911012.1 ComEA family DNA-binding protein [Inconstantimicrobium porci]
MRRKEKIIGAIIIVVIAAVCITVGYFNSSSKKISQKDVEAMFIDDGKGSLKSTGTFSDNSSTSNKKSISKDGSNKNTGGVINVEIKGAVKNPDVYKMDSGSIVNDLIQKSGGANNDADMSSINRAAKLCDNQCIVIPKKGEKSLATPNNTINNTSSVLSGNTQSELININTADKETLKKLSGIGDGRAQKIIDYRTEHGEFKNIDEIRNISGIGEAIYNNIKNKITV